MKNPIICQGAVILAVHDGDTYTAAIDLKPLFGFSCSFSAKVRAAYINAAELPSPEGEADTTLAKMFFFGTGEAHPFTLEVFGRDKYGRVLAEAWMPDLSGLSFSQHMLASKTVVPMKLTTQLPPDVR